MFEAKSSRLHGVLEGEGESSSQWCWREPCLLLGGGDGEVCT